MKAAPALALALAAALAAGCGEPTYARPAPPHCPAGQVAEWEEDDGWECEPDENGNGIDDEDDDAKAAGKRKPPRPRRR